MATRKNGTTTDPVTGESTVPEAIDVDSNGWRPSPGDILTGTLTDITIGGTGRASFGVYPIITLRKANGTEVMVHAFHHTLRTRLKEMRPELGHELTITYLGRQNQVNRDGSPRMDENGAQFALEMYEVTSPQFEFDWSQI